MSALTFDVEQFKFVTSVACGRARSRSGKRLLREDRIRGEETPGERKRNAAWQERRQGKLN